MKRIGMFVIITLIMGALALSSAVTPSISADKAKTLEDLLKGADFPFKKLDGDNYQVIVIADGKTCVTVAHETNVSNQAETKLVYLFTPVVELPKNQRPSQALLNKIAEVNDTLIVGKVSISEGVIFYNSSFWLRTADSQILTYELLLSFKNSEDLKQMFLRFLEE